MVRMIMIEKQQQQQEQEEQGSSSGAAMRSKIDDGTGCDQVIQVVISSDPGQKSGSQNAADTSQGIQSIESAAANGGFVAVEILQPQQEQHEESPNGAFAEKSASKSLKDDDQCEHHQEEDDDEEEGRICRVCHLSLSRDLSGNEDSIEIGGGAGMEAIELGCGCKDDLAFAHRRCAETWFKIKGNRTCEICGQLVPNVAPGGFEDGSYGRRSDERSDSLYNLDHLHQPQDEVRSFWHHRPICNFVLAFIVVILLLPWLFRIRLF